MRKLLRMLFLTLVLTVGLFSTALPTYAQQPSQSRWTPSRFHRADGRGEPVTRSPSRFTIDNHGGDSWAGFVVGSGIGNGFQGVEANWNAECTSPPLDSQHLYGSWVGLGGYFNGDSLEQAGIALQQDGTYRLFWEYVWSTYSDPPFYDENDVIHCGDHISAWVHFGCGSNNSFYAHVQDNTTGAHLGSTCLTKSTGIGIQSADWIDERPLVSCGGPSNLADFNWTDWSNVLAQANYSGAPWANPNSFVNTRLFMSDFTTGTDIAWPDQSSVTNNNIFTDRWHGYGTYCD